MRTKSQQEISDEQAGFREGRGTRDQIVNIRNVIEKCREDNQPLYLCFINYSKAFDCVSHPKRWITMKKMGFPCHFVALIASLYQNQQSAVRTGGVNGLKSEEACARDVSYHQTSSKYTLRTS